MVKSKQTIEKTIKKIKSLGFTDILEFEGDEQKCYFNSKWNIGIFVNPQEKGYPTLFEVCWYQKRKNDVYDLECMFRVSGMKELTQSLNEIEIEYFTK